MTAAVGAGMSVSALTALRRSAAFLAARSPGPRGRRHWRELGNKLAAFEVFRRAEARARAAGREVPLAVLVERTFGLPLSTRLWALEGLGYGHAEGRAAAGAEALGWPAADSSSLPAASLIALHCGMGLSLARRRLAASAGAPAAELRRALAAYVTDCRRLAWPGHAAALLEALGFIARLRFARRAGEVARELARLDEEAHACFWHGRGRALYFLPRHAPPWPGAPRWLLATMAREAPPGECRENVLAGLAWAVTLINLRHPQVLEEFLTGQALGAAAAPGLAHGIGSSILVWHDCAPDEPCLASWRRYRPPPEGGGAIGLWEREVSGPAEAAIARDADRPGRTPDVGDLFRVRSQPVAAASRPTAAAPAPAAALPAATVPSN